MPTADRRCIWVLVLALTLISWHQSTLVLPKGISKHCRQALELIFDERKAIKIREEGRPIRIQLLDEMDNINFFALVALTTLQQSPRGRCAIIVTNNEIALATCEKLLEHKIHTNVSTLKFPSDPTARIAVCTRRIASQALLGQRFETMVLGYVPVSENLLQPGIRCVKNVHAEREVQVAPSFFVNRLETDFAYFYSKAYQDGKVAPLNAFSMPMLIDTPARDAFIDKVIQVLRRKMADWGPTFLFITKLDLATYAAAKLQSLGISAKLWPNGQYADREREGIANALAQGDLDVVCSTRMRDTNFLPTCVRSIVSVTFSWSGSRQVPAALFKALRSLRLSRNNCTFLHVCGNRATHCDFLGDAKRGAMSLPFWHEREDQSLSLEEIGSILDKTAGVSFNLLKPNGEIAEATDQNAKAILAMEKTNGLKQHDS